MVPQDGQTRFVPSSGFATSLQPRVDCEARPLATGRTAVKHLLKARLRRWLPCTDGDQAGALCYQPRRFSEGRFVSIRKPAAPMPHAFAKPLSALPSGPLRGRVVVPGDKSISHRSLMLGALAIGETRIAGLLESADVMATAAAMRAFGAKVEQGGDGVWRVHGLGTGGLLEPEGVIDFGNAGTGVRLAHRHRRRACLRHHLCRRRLAVAAARWGACSSRCATWARR